MDKFVELKIADIEIGERLRALDSSQVNLLAETLKQTPLQNPIVVAFLEGNYRLVSGAHRIAAFQQNGLKKIPGHVIELLKFHELEQMTLMEIDENLVRNDLTYLDRGLHFIERKRVHKVLHPESKRGGDRRSKEAQEIQSVPDALWSVIAEKSGLGRRAYFENVAIVERLTATSIEALRATKFAENKGDLKLLSQQNEAMQEKVIFLLFHADHNFNSVADVLTHLNGGRPTKDEATKNWTALSTSWKRLTPKARRAFYNEQRKEFLAYAKKEGWI